MSPKEKATGIVLKYINATFNCKSCDIPYCDIPCTTLNYSEALECAIIAVDEILTLGLDIGDYNDFKDCPPEWYASYWGDVKNELLNYEIVTQTNIQGSITEKIQKIG